MAGIPHVCLAGILVIIALACIQPSSCAPFNWDKVTLTKEQEAVISKVDALLNSLLQNILEEYKRANPHKKLPAAEETIIEENDSMDVLITKSPTEVSTNYLPSEVNSHIDTDNGTESNAIPDHSKKSSLTNPPSAVTTLQAEVDRSEYEKPDYDGEEILFPLYKK